VPGNCLPALDKQAFVWYIITMRATKDMKVNDLVRHRDNPRWQAVILKDLHPRRPVNGFVRVAHLTPLGTVHICKMPKDILKIVLDN